VVAALLKLGCCHGGSIGYIKHAASMAAAAIVTGRTAAAVSSVPGREEVSEVDVAAVPSPAARHANRSSTQQDQASANPGSIHIYSYLGGLGCTEHMHPCARACRARQK
jgi:hypothetical protein